VTAEPVASPFAATRAAPVTFVCRNGAVPPCQCGPCFVLVGAGDGDVDPGGVDGWPVGVGGGELGPGVGGGRPLLTCNTIVDPCGTELPATGVVYATVPAGRSDST
jgi:hypothetical protein